MNLANSPLISVVMITYNHENFIQQAIEGVLMQEFSGEIELIIANDCSPDGTDGVIKTIIENHPRGAWIKYTNHPVNMGMMNNFIWALKQAKGKYVALCEGDDYWIDSLKLQKQSSVMDRDSNCNIVYHNCMKIDSFGKEIELVYDLNYNKELTISDLLKGDYTKTCTILIRNGFDSLPSEFLDDTLFAMTLLEQGSKAIYIPEVLSIYRIHPGGVWSMKSKTERFLQSELIEKLIYQHFSVRFPNLVLERYLNFYSSESINLVRSKSYKQGFYGFGKYLKKENSMPMKLLNSLRFFKWFLISFVNQK
jgi:glycosyltransferase involved in cell wall biosynthesis